MPRNQAVPKNGAPRMDNGTYLSPARRIAIKKEIPKQEWAEYSKYKYVAISAGDGSSRILDGDNDDEALTERMEVDPSVDRYFISENSSMLSVATRRAK